MGYGAIDYAAVNTLTVMRTILRIKPVPAAPMGSAQLVEKPLVAILSIRG
jgi:hypothetical protein